MCGITGIFETRSRAEISRGMLARMNESQHHRGPDEGSYLVEPGLGFGHRRLSIIDIATGQQPLFNEDGSVAVIFNGEIYNFRANPGIDRPWPCVPNQERYRSDRARMGGVGPSCVERFRGMFAFALGTGIGRRHFARDRSRNRHYALLPEGSRYLVRAQVASFTAGFRSISIRRPWRNTSRWGMFPSHGRFCWRDEAAPGRTIPFRRGVPSTGQTILGRALHARQSDVRSRRLRGVDVRLRESVRPA